MKTTLHIGMPLLRPIKTLVKLHSKSACPIASSAAASVLLASPSSPHPSDATCRLEDKFLAYVHLKHAGAMAVAMKTLSKPIKTH